MPRHPSPPGQPSFAYARKSSILVTLKHAATLDRLCSAELRPVRADEIRNATYLGHAADELAPTIEIIDSVAPRFQDVVSLC